MENYRGGYQIIDLTKYYNKESFNETELNELRNIYNIYAQNSKRVILNIGDKTFEDVAINFYKDDANVEYFVVYIKNSIIFEVAFDDGSVVTAFDVQNKIKTRIGISGIIGEEGIHIYATTYLSKELIESYAGDSIILDNVNYALFDSSIAYINGACITPIEIH